MSHHPHTHSHGHHHHAPTGFGRAFALGIGLNAAFVLIEGGYGFFANSMALLADAGHNLSDILGLLVAWAAFAMAARKPTERFTYGFGQCSILAALFNAVFLMVAVGAIAWEALQRFAAPQPVAGGIVMGVALVGIGVNGFTAWLFARGRHHDINIRGAYLHMLADAAVSLGVVAAGLVITATGWQWVDPLTSLAIAALITWGTWSLLREALHMSLSAAPSGTSVSSIRAYLTSIEGVAGVHDLHVWPLSTTQTALTCHLVVPAAEHHTDAFLHGTIAELKEHFAIHHATIQLEHADTGTCEDCAHGHNARHHEDGHHHHH